MIKRGYNHHPSLRLQALSRALPIFTAACLTVASLSGLPASVHAAEAPSQGYQIQPEFDPSLPSAYTRDLIERLQRALTSSGIYIGPVSGKVDDATDKAIRAYQKMVGRSPTGIVDEDLVKHAETTVNVGGLLDKLSVARKVHSDAARQALLNHPATRDLVTGLIEDATANAARDPSVCFNAPTVRCLLDEALESAKTVSRDEMRNWVYGEILVTQARAGLTDAARDTARRISDPRLIIVALGRIAEAQALSGSLEGALSAADVIPDADERADVYANIADILSKNGNLMGAQTALLKLRTQAVGMRSDVKRVAHLSRAGVILTKIGMVQDADRLLVELEALARAVSDPTRRSAALRYVAEARSARGDLAQALNMLADVTNNAERIPVLMSTAVAQARAGDANAALVTAQLIETMRYRAVVLSSIGIGQAASGRGADAMKILESALDITKKIRLPFARDYALSRIALAYAEIGSSNIIPDAGMYLRASSVADTVKDKRLRAETFWRIAFFKREAGASAPGDAMDRAFAVTEKIKSAPSRAWLLADLAENRASKGHGNLAWQLFDHSVAITREIPNSWGRARALGRLAQTLISLAETSSEHASLP